MEIIEGRRTLVVDRTPPLPESLSILLEGGRDSRGRVWHPLRTIHSTPLRISGARSSCLGQDHRLQDWLQGFHTGSDLLDRHLVLQACQDCGAVCVRDRSYDTLDRLPTGGREPRRRDHVIGWYTGARPLGRQFFAMGRSPQ